MIASAASSRWRFLRVSTIAVFTIVRSIILHALIIIHIIDVPAVQSSKVQESGDSSGFEASDVMSCSLKSIDRDLQISEIRPNMMWCCSDELGAVCNPIESGTTLLIMLHHNHSSRTMPSNLLEVRGTAVSPVEAALAQSQRPLLALVLPKKSTPELSIHLGSSDSISSGSSTLQGLLKGLVSFKVCWAK